MIAGLVLAGLGGIVAGVIIDRIWLYWLMRD